MTRQDVLNSLRNLTTDRQIQWMFDFGYQLTVSARGAYVAGELAGDAVRLMGFAREIPTPRRLGEWSAVQVQRAMER